MYVHFKRVKYRSTFRRQVDMHREAYATTQDKEVLRLTVEHVSRPSTIQVMLTDNRRFETNVYKALRGGYLEGHQFDRVISASYR